MAAEHTDSGGSRPRHPRREAGKTTGTDRQPARILVVEDQDDVRRMMVTALEIDGHRVDGAANAREGLKRLQEARYKLVLSDYAMPGGTGTWMLAEAARRGLMGDDTVALIVTAHPDVRELTDLEVITKPIDLDRFLEQVRRMLSSPDGNPDMKAIARRTVSDEYRAELVLYISSESAASLQARRNLERLLARFERSQVKVTICDLGQDPLAGEADRVAFTPTLVKRHPEPRMWVLGNLREADIVADMLRVAGVDTKE